MTIFSIIYPCAYMHETIEERIDALEAKEKATRYVLGCFVLMSLFNFGVALWFFQQKTSPDWNYIAVTLTIFEVFLAIILVVGYWMLRSVSYSPMIGQFSA